MEGGRLQAVNFDDKSTGIGRVRLAILVWQRRGISMKSSWTRREFLNLAGFSAASLAIANRTAFALEPPAALPPLQDRFLAHVPVVRVNQIEVTPTRNLGEDEAPLNRPDHI